MSALVILIPISLLLLGIAVGAFFWAVNRGQFDDLDTPPLRILEEDPPRGGEQHRAPSARSDSAEPLPGPAPGADARGPRDSGPPAT